MHLVGRGLSLDRRAAGQRGAAAANPHGLVQEFLNRSDGHLWAIVSNGLRLRILRDNQALSRQSYIEFDLEAMFAGEVYSDLVLLWLVVHASRFVPREGEQPETCWLEQWTREAEQQGARALGELRGGVERALRILGRGFTSHPRNAALRERLRTGALSPDGLHGQLLRVVYRLIFLFVAEDRTLDGQSLLHPRDDSDGARAAREAYAAHYGAARLRHLAGRIKGSRHGDLWRQFRLLADALSGEPDLETARRRLALPALGSFLWSRESTPELNDAELTNHDFLEALRHLAFTRQNKILRPVDYRNLGTEELGGVYEGLLALTPQVSGDGADFTFAEFAGNARKTSGSYYTPDSLVQCLLDSALDPVVKEAVRGKTGADAERAILDLKVCDPAVGSGHFLVGAAHRLARHLARVRAHAAGESEPSPLLYQHALRDVIGRCLYGVDMNPMAAELCRVSLWLEALEPGKPLSFLDHHIRVGNSLIGTTTTPELIEAGLPDEAFKAQQGDDRKVCSGLRRRNKAERESGQQDMGYLMVAEPSAEYDTLGSRIRWIDESPDDTLGEVQGKDAQFRRMVASGEYRHRQLVADAWCAAFVQPKGVGTGRDPALCITTDTLRGLEADPEALAPAQRRDVERLAREYQFFHWHLVFPEVFEGGGERGGAGGFDCVLGNPPWERVKLQEKEWFAQRSPEIADAPNAAARKRMIRALADNDPELHQAFLDALRRSEGWSHLMRNSGRYPKCARGDINSYAVFAEGMRNVVNERGRVGCVLPTGIATDDTTKFFFQDVVGAKSLVSLFDFENRRGLFPDVDSRMKFCLFTAGSGAQPAADHAEYVFFAHADDELRDPERRFTLSPEDIALLNPNTRTCPTFRSRSDAELAKAIYRRVPVLIRGARDGQSGDNPWGIRLSTMFHMSNDSHLFHTREQLEGDGWRLSRNVFRRDNAEYLPLYEGRLGHQHNHRFASQPRGKMRTLTQTEMRDPNVFVEPQNWVLDDEANIRLLRRTANCRTGLLGFRRVSSNTNERTCIATIIPWGATSYGWILSFGPDVHYLSLLCGIYNSFVFDFLLRCSLSQPSVPQSTFEQIPVPQPHVFARPCPWEHSHRTIDEWILSRILELSYTAWDLESFARDCGWHGPPFRWDDDRRFLLRCELDAAIFHLYLQAEDHGGWRPVRHSDGCPRDKTPEQLAALTRCFPTPRDAVAYIMDTFPIVRRKDEVTHREYRTKRIILEIYDAMQASRATGGCYQTRLDPTPADTRCCHPPRENP